MFSERLESGAGRLHADAPRWKQSPHSRIFSDLPEEASVLIIRLRSMGDTILMTPALRLLHNWRPDLRISVLLERPWNELLENNPAVRSIIVLNGKLLTTWRLRQANFSAVVNLHGGPTSALLTRVTGSRWRAGFEHFRDGLQYGFAYNLRVPRAQQILGREGPVHTAEHVASCFFWLGVPFEEIPPAQIFPSSDARAAVAARLGKMGMGHGRPYAVIHPTASLATKQWSPNGFAEVGEFLERHFGIRAVYVCGAGESSALDKIESCSRGHILRAAGWKMRELAALIANARIFVGNDSGPAHLAAAAGIPTLAIFGSSHAAVWRPWKAVASVVVQNYFDCNPCPGDRCYAFDEPRCILSISPEQVKVCLEGLLSAVTSDK